MTGRNKFNRTRVRANLFESRLKLQATPAVACVLATMGRRLTCEIACAGASRCTPEQSPSAVPGDLPLSGSSECSRSRREPRQVFRGTHGTVLKPKPDARPAD